jgi:hypothetical protein
MTNEYPPTIDQFLTAFFERHRTGKPAATVARIDYLDTLLRRCLEEDNDWLDCPECRSLVALERLVNPVNPFATVISLEKLVTALAYFVHSPWLRSDPAMQAAQWRLVEALLDALDAHPRMDWWGLEQTSAVLRGHIDHGLRRSNRTKGHRRR